MNPTKINRKKILEKLKKNNLIAKPIVDEIIDKNPEINIQDNIKINKIHKLDDKIISCLPTIHNIKTNTCDDYVYKLYKVLNTNNVLDYKLPRLVHLCIFQINCNEKTTPYILYLLNKDINTNIVYFPHFTVSNNILKHAEKHINDIFTDWKITPKFKGHIDNKDLYLFYEIDFNYTIYKLKYNDLWWWTTIFEIVNIKSILNFKIDNSVSHIFNKYHLLISLFNKKNHKIAIPTIGYHGGYYNYIKFIAAFGLRKVSHEGYLGPYYYFDTYKGAGRYAIWNTVRKPEYVDKKLITLDEYGKYKDGGIVRFIIFCNLTKYLLNRPTDPDDNSELSIELASKIPFIKSTMKIRDVAGKWADNYDSVYVGSTLIKSEKYDDRVLNIQFAIKNFNNFIPISYHYVNTNQFDNITDPIKQKSLPFNYIDYNIM